jgi:hypothetical protein
LNLDKSAGRRRVEAAIARGYVRNRESGRGKPAKLALGDPLPMDVAVLPSSDLVAGWQGELRDKGPIVETEECDSW